MGSQKSADSRLVRKVRAGALLEMYGALLTERQREFVRLHHSEDMSLGEIARDFGVSRQAIHDAVRQAEATMEHYEAALGLLANSAGQDGEEQAQDAGTLEPIIEELDGLRRRLGSQGIIYDSDDYVRVLDGVVERLKELAGGSPVEQ